MLHSLRERILTMARERMMDGYVQYGSEMYDWTPEQRLTEICEELADALVYSCSGPLD